MADQTVEKDCTVRNRMGLHARPAALIVQTANKFPCEVTLEKDGQNVNGKSIMGVLMLAATQGSIITVRTEGSDAEPALKALGELVQAGFGEGS